jgi:predicted ATPase/DNA-binding winged helix-turn-helix (wHTH) protein
VIYSFDRFELDTRLYQLRHEGQVIKLDRKAFDTLRFLVENRDRVVHKDELMRRLWPNEIVVEAVIPAAIRRIRRALGQARQDRRPIETAHGRGYRFASPATTVAPRVALGTSRDAMGSEPPDPFVGRADLVAPLRLAERAAESGEGRLVLLSGEPGVGKTRLLQHVCHGAKTEGKSVWTGQCYEGEGAPAFWPWIQVVRQSLSELSARDIAQLPGEVVADLGLLVPELVSRTALPARERDPDAARFRLYDSISRFLFRLSEAAYRLIVVDDLHWADHASLALLDFVAARLGERRLLLLAAVRTGELPKDHPNRERIDRLTRHTGALRVEVGGFNREEVAEYIATLTGVLPPDRLAEQVFRRTGGNPLFTRETVRLFSRPSNGSVPFMESTFSTPELPDAAKDVIRRRLQRLAEPARHVLELMSVGRGAFDLALIGAAASMDAESLLGALDASVQAGMLVKKA